MDSELRLAELLSTRLCHDLTGPIGAVNNGAEFLNEEGFSMREQAIELIIGSAKQAVIRLQFYRQAYGRVNYQGEASLDEFRSLAREFFEESRVELDWPNEYADAADVSVSRKMAKLVVNALILISGALPRGGSISVEVGKQEDGQAKVKVHGEGATVKMDADMLDALSLKASLNDLTPKNVQPYYMGKLAKLIGVQLTHDISEKHFTIEATHA